MGLTIGKNPHKVTDDPINLQQWMTLLRDDIRRNVAIIHLAIPGSHNSMTYDIKWNSKLAPDADHAIRRLYRWLPWFIFRWAKTQKYPVTAQLNHGIRFFDLRISKLEKVSSPREASNINKNLYYFVHGLYSGPVGEAMNEIDVFLNNNPGEVVILDFQHFYDIGHRDHYFLYRIIKTVFGNKLYGPRDGELDELTLLQAYKRRKQVVVIYRGPFMAPDYWNGSTWPTPWPQTSSLKTLRRFLDDSLQHRSFENGWVSQCILTPDAKYIGIRPFRTLEYTAKEVIKKLSDWINEQVPGPWEEDDENENKTVKRVNVIIADFVNLKNAIFTTAVISLNNKIPIIYHDDSHNDLENDNTK